MDAAKAVQVSVDTSKMPGSLVFFHIADATEGMLGLEDGLPERRIGEGTGGQGGCYPGWIVPVVGRGCSDEQKAAGLYVDVAIGQFMLNGLKVANGMTELLADFGMFNSQFKGSVRSSERPGSAAKSSEQSHLPQAVLGQRNELAHCILKANVTKWGDGEARCWGNGHTRNICAEECNRRIRDDHQQVSREWEAFHKADGAGEMGIGARRGYTIDMTSLDIAVIGTQRQAYGRCPCCQFLE
jgi:hypothetical protein